MTEFEFSPSEDRRFDHLVDVELKDAAEAQEIIRKERDLAFWEQRSIMAARAVAEVANTPDLTTKPEHPKYKHTNRRGGRSYPVISDSEGDPNWNGQIPAEPVKDPIAAEEAFQELMIDVDKAAVDTIAARKNITPEQALGVRKAQKEKNQRLG